MAINASLNVTDGSLNVISKSWTRTPAGPSKLIQEVTVTFGAEVTVPIPADIGNVREIAILNLDATNYVRVGFATGVYQLRVRAGEAVLFTPEDPTIANLFIRADTGNCQALLYVAEE